MQFCWLHLVQARNIFGFWYWLTDQLVLQHLKLVDFGEGALVSPRRLVMTSWGLCFLMITCKKFFAVLCLLCFEMVWYMITRWFINHCSYLVFDHLYNIARVRGVNVQNLTRNSNRLFVDDPDPKHIAKCTWFGESSYSSLS